MIFLSYKEYLNNVLDPKNLGHYVHTFSKIDFILKRKIERDNKIGKNITIKWKPQLNKNRIGEKNCGEKEVSGFFFDQNCHQFLISVFHFFNEWLSPLPFICCNFLTNSILMTTMHNSPSPLLFSFIFFFYFHFFLFKILYSSIFRIVTC